MPSDTGGHAYIGLSGGHILGVGDEQLLHVVGGAVLLQLVLDSPYQLTLHLQTHEDKMETWRGVSIYQSTYFVDTRVYSHWRQLVVT